MDWIIDGVTKGIFGFIANIISDFLTQAFKLLTDFLLASTNINQYVSVSTYLNYVYAIAYPFFMLAVFFEAFKQNSNGMIDAEEMSLDQFILKIFWTAFLIWYLPKTVTVAFIPINNALVNLVQDIGIKVDASSFSKILTTYDLGTGFMSLGAFTLGLLLILAVGFIILGIVSGIRYIEIIICVIIAPIAAISALKKGDALQVWIRETTAIVFTQALHIFLLQFLMSVIANVQGPMMILMSIGILVVMLKGPQLLRQFLYSSGVGSATVQSVGGAGRMAAMKLMFQSASPTA